MGVVEVSKVFYRLIVLFNGKVVKLDVKLSFLMFEKNIVDFDICNGFILKFFRISDLGIELLYKIFFFIG